MGLLLDDIASYLQSLGVGTVDVDLFKGALPDLPDNCATLFECAGLPPDLHWNGERPELKVRVRNTDYAAGRAKAEAVVTALHGLAETTLGATRYLLIRAKQSPEGLGKDASGRHEWVVIFSIIKER